MESFRPDLAQSLQFNVECLKKVVANKIKDGIMNSEILEPGKPSSQITVLNDAVKLKKECSCNCVNCPSREGNHGNGKKQITSEELTESNLRMS